jgi:hypothetical protein
LLFNAGWAHREGEMKHAFDNIPEINPSVVRDARLYANRQEMVKGLRITKHGVIAEVGVAAGDFSDFLIRLLQPSKFIAVDTFDMDKAPVIWGIPQEVLFSGMGQLGHYKHRFQFLGDRLNILRGNSHEVMKDVPDKSVDLIYVDAGHDYVNVCMDIEVCAKKVKDDGIMIFNDYVLHDPFTNDDYGVVCAVNEMLSTGRWQVVGFALQRHMFCDIAVRQSL